MQAEYKETGWLGVTQTPGEQPNKYNSVDNGVHVLLNSTLSAEGKAQMLSHELYGHADTYIDATTVSELDLNFKNKKAAHWWPGIQLLILHNYGSPIRY